MIADGWELVPDKHLAADVAAATALVRCEADGGDSGVRAAAVWKALDPDVFETTAQLAQALVRGGWRGWVEQAGFKRSIVLWRSTDAGREAARA